jgi:F0F1-type ATP synthase assembly protein I
MKPPKAPIPIILLASSVPVAFGLVILGAALRDRVLPGEISGGLIALLAGISASTFAFYGRKDNDDDA